MSTQTFPECMFPIQKKQGLTNRKYSSIAKYLDSEIYLYEIEHDIHTIYYIITYIDLYVLLYKYIN